MPKYKYKYKYKCFIFWVPKYKYKYKYFENVFKYTLNTNTIAFDPPLVSGQVAFEEEGPRIFPLTQFPDSTINLASAQLVNSHKNKFVDERIYGQVRKCSFR